MPETGRLEVREISKIFAKRRVVDRVSLEVSPGEIVGLLGPNGAGKTTTFRIVVGLLRQESGRVFLNGQDISLLPLNRRARLGIGYLPQETSVFQGLTVGENILAILETRRMDTKERKARLTELLERIGIAPLVNSRAYTLSGGEKRRLEIARALATDPAFLLLDEPFTGIDPKTVGEIQVLIRELRDRLSLGILITDHQVRETLEVTDRSYIIDHGRVFRSGLPQELVDDPEVRQVYLGDRFYMRHVEEEAKPNETAEPQPEEYGHGSGI